MPGGLRAVIIGHNLRVRAATPVDTANSIFRGEVAATFMPSRFYPVSPEPVRERLITWQSDQFSGSGPVAASLFQRPRKIMARYSGDDLGQVQAFSERLVQDFGGLSWRYRQHGGGNVVAAYG